MKGTATVTTRTTVTPVTVTEVKNGTVRHSMGTTIIVQTDEGYRSFTQSDIDKRGVKIMRDGKPALVSDFRHGDKLTRDHHHVEAAAGHDRAAGERHPRGGGPGRRRRWRRRRSSVRGAGRVGVRPGGQVGVSVIGRRVGIGWRRQDAAEDRQLVAARRCRERPVAGHRARPDDQAPRRRLALQLNVTLRASSDALWRDK